jgi:uridine kinase
MAWMAESRVVLVGGGTASGKTTVVRAFVARTGALHIAHDRYYRDAPDPHNHDFDHPDALETALLVDHLKGLKRGDVVDLPRYGFPHHRRLTEVDPVAAEGLIIVEGILVLCAPTLVSIADFTVFVDAPDSVRLDRRIERDMAQRGRSRDAVLQQYAATVRPAHERFVAPCMATADLVIDGTAPVEDLVGQLMTALAAR